MHRQLALDQLAMGIVAVVGAAGWEDPWSRATYLDVVHGRNEYELRLVDEHGYDVDERDVQLARLETLVH